MDRHHRDGHVERRTPERRNNEIEIIINDEAAPYTETASKDVFEKSRLRNQYTPMSLENHRIAFYYKISEDLVLESTFRTSATLY